MSENLAQMRQEIASKGFRAQIYSGLSALALAGAVACCIAIPGAGGFAAAYIAGAVISGISAFVAGSVAYRNHTESQLLTTTYRASTWTQAAGPTQGQGPQLQHVMGLMDETLHAAPAGGQDAPSPGGDLAGRMAGGFLGGLAARGSGWTRG